MSNTQEIGWKAVSKTGVVAAGGAKAVAAGIEILEAGGNAADAAAGTILALNVTDHGACSIGGEVPLLIFDAEKTGSEITLRTRTCTAFAKCYRLVYGKRYSKRRHQNGTGAIGC